VTPIPDDSQLAGLDPYDLLEEEARRLADFFASLPDEGWDTPSRCEGWTVRDVLAHLAASQAYHHACLDDSLDDFMFAGLDAGATGLDGFNEWGIRKYDGSSPAEILEEWTAATAEQIDRMRARDGGTMTTMVPDYPVRIQAFHCATEIATHADDVGAPVPATEPDDRTSWRLRFNRVALAEDGKDVEITSLGGRSRVRAGDAEAELSDADLVDAMAGRLPGDHPLPTELRTALALA
jgi:uncharacterized protein (TIGR03083 family)